MIKVWTVFLIAWSSASLARTDCNAPDKPCEKPNISGHAPVMIIKHPQDPTAGDKIFLPKHQANNSAPAFHSQRASRQCDQRG
jgi:hypothetical protein